MTGFAVCKYSDVWRDLITIANAIVPTFEIHVYNSIFFVVIICPHSFLMGGNFVHCSMNRYFRYHGLLFVRA